jgi:predicted AlkP superfamily phosphohydrolase/phosphomutase
VEEERRKVVAVGLDAANWEYLCRRMDAGDLPNLTALVGSSLRCRLENTQEYRSELPWTTFNSGRYGKSIKYWSTVRFDPETYEALDLGAHPGAPFWADLPARRVIAFDVPHSVFGDDPDVVQVNAWGAHSGQFPRSSSPQGLLTEIDERFGPHPAFTADYETCWHEPQYLRDLSEALVTGVHRRAEICRWLMDQHPDWELFVTVLSEPHSIGHHAWHGADPGHPLHDHAIAEVARTAMDDVHRAVDDTIGALREAAGPDVAFVVFAVHGMAPNTNDLPAQAVVPELLYRLSFGSSALANPSRAHGARDDSFWPLPPGYTNRYLSRLYADDTRDRIARDVWRWTPPRLQELRWRVRGRLRGKPTRSFPSVADFESPPEARGTNDELLQLEAGEQAFQGPKLYQRHWPRMRAFALPTYSDAHIRLNVVGRERDGIIAKEDYVATCDEIEAELQALTDIMDGGPVIKEVIRVREDDPFDPEGPSADLVVVFDRPTIGCDHPRAGRLGPFPTLRTGEHDNNGFFVMSAPWIRPDEIHDRSALDVPATIAALVGGDVSIDFDGRPVGEALPG